MPISGERDEREARERAVREAVRAGDTAAAVAAALPGNVASANSALAAIALAQVVERGEAAMNMQWTIDRQDDAVAATTESTTATDFGGPSLDEMD